MTTPQRLGRYELLEQLGEGGMGAVWLSRLTGTGGFEKLCIVKTVLPAIAKDKSFVSRFLHEGRILTQLQHSNIAQVLDMGDEGGTLFIALEYVAGVDLSRLHGHVRDGGGALPVPVCLYLIQQSAEGLGAVHRKAAVDGTPLNIVHRDVSPQNLMVSYEGEVKVIDFGISKSEARSQATGTPTVMGKLGYMAPEQARGENVDHRADQYALAVIFWELLANKPFVNRGTMTEMVVAMAHPALKPLAPLRPEVPASLEAVVQRALAATPEQRFATTDDFARALLDELVRLSGMPSKMQLGEYVRAQCAPEYQSTQALLTRVSTVRGLNTVPGTPSTVTTSPTTLGLEPTALRPSGEFRAASPAAPGEPMTTAQLQAAAMPTSRAPLFIGLALTAVVVVAGAGYLLTQPRRAAAPTDAKDLTARDVTAKANLPTLTPVQVTPPPEAPKPPGKEPDAVIAPPITDLVNAAAGDLVDAKKTVKLFTDADKTYVSAGQGDGLVVGSTVVIVGPPQADGKRQQLGTGTVMEVFPKMSRVALDAGAAKAQGERFVAVGEVKEVAGVSNTLEVKRAVELFADGDKQWVRAGQPDGLVPGQDLVIVGPPQSDGKRLKLGAVMEVQGKLARVLLDPDAAKASGERFAALDKAAAAAPGATTPAPGGTAKGPMSAAVKLQTTPIFSVYLTNTSKFNWNACTLFAPGQRRFGFPSMLPGARREFPVNLFVFDPAAPNLVNEVQVACKEGTIRVPAQ
jgi:eukaryotic-like serine/threonine-protein kinase